MILGVDGVKMSKSRGNVINPDYIVQNWGADTLRVYEMFMGPLEAMKPWSMQGVDGARRFLDRVWRLYTEQVEIVDADSSNLEKVYHQTVKKVTEDYEALRFNTAIAQMMIFVNDCYKEEKVSKQYMEGLVKLISPIIPHVGEEMWNLLGHNKTLAYENWPTYDEKL